MIEVSSISFIFEAILLSSILVGILAWLSIRLTRRVGLLDHPNSAPHKHHQVATPIAGGLALFGGLLLSGWLMGTLQDTNVRAALISGSVVFLFGLMDDFRGISPLLKILGQLLAVVILIALGVSVRVFESPEFLLVVSWPLSLYLDWLVTFFWVVGITNAFNFVDSMDGLAVGLGGIVAAFFMLVTIASGQFLISLQSALVLGACIALFFFNSPPARLFLGDSGAQTLGFFMAVLAIAYLPQGANQSSSWVVPIMLLGVPIFDMVLVVISRLRRGKPVYAAALDHTYHRLVVSGWESTWAVVGMQVVSLLLGCLAFVVLTRPPVVANAVFIGVLLAGFLALYSLDNRKRWP
jgi:UDP-GlcNAc:undecaprenyl-phosphate GlcNAc-1-phosphate transferase